jgi:hypothetical protein
MSGRRARKVELGRVQGDRVASTFGATSDEISVTVAGDDSAPRHKERDDQRVQNWTMPVVVSNASTALKMPADVCPGRGGGAGRRDRRTPA